MIGTRSVASISSTAKIAARIGPHDLDDFVGLAIRRRDPIVAVFAQHVVGREDQTLGAHDDARGILVGNELGVARPGNAAAN